MEDLFADVEIHMKHALGHLHNEFKHLRTGRASLAVLDGITVEHEGTPIPINQCAAITVADASTIIAQPHDLSRITDIERAIRDSKRGLDPSNDGKLIRVAVLPLTDAQRAQLVKKAHDLAESARNGVRAARRDGNIKLKKKEGTRRSVPTTNAVVWTQYRGFTTTTSTRSVRRPERSSNRSWMFESDKGTEGICPTPDHASRFRPFMALMFVQSAALTTASDTCPSNRSRRGR